MPYSTLPPWIGGIADRPDIRAHVSHLHAVPFPVDTEEGRVFFFVVFILKV